MFNVGDKVVGNNNNYPHRQGKFGVVSEVDHIGVFWVTWKDDGETNVTYESEIDIVEDTKEENPVTAFKPGDKINWKWKKDKWGDNPEWQERAYTINEDMTKAYHDDGGRITLCNEEIDYRLVEPTKEEDISEKCSYKMWGEMSPEEKGALLLAKHEGKPIQAKFQDPGDTWDDEEYDFNCDCLCYRVKPEETPKEPEREVVALKTQDHTYIKVKDKTFTKYSRGENAVYDSLAVFEMNLPEADEVFYKGDTISFVL